MSIFRSVSSSLTSRGQASPLSVLPAFLLVRYLIPSLAISQISRLAASQLVLFHISQPPNWSYFTSRSLPIGPISHLAASQLVLFHIWQPPNWSYFTSRSLPIGQEHISQPLYMSGFTPLCAPSLPIGQVTHSQPPYWSGFTPLRGPSLPIGPASPMSVLPASLLVR